jgi:FG-GAP-like repeat
LGYSVLLGNGDGSFQSPVSYPQNVNRGGTAIVADFNHDGKLDLAVADGQSVAVLLGNGDGTFAAPVLYYDGGGGFIVTARKQ